MEAENYLQGAALSLIRAMANMFNTSLYSDVEVHCRNGERYPCHRLVLCTQSRVFAKACNPACGLENTSHKKPYKNVINIPSDDPAVVKAVLEFLYRFDYSTPGAEEPFNLEYPVLFHIDMYAASEHYQVPGLKILATERAKLALQQALLQPCFSDAVKLIYQTTNDEGRGLRDVVVDIAARNFGMLMNNNPKFKETLDQVTPFAQDLATIVNGGKGWMMRSFLCPIDGCGHVFAADLQGYSEESVLYCAQCNYGLTLREWGEV